MNVLSIIINPKNIRAATNSMNKLKESRQIAISIINRSVPREGEMQCITNT